MSKKVVLASGNRGKLAELRAMLDPLGWELLPQNCFFDDEAEENGLSFVENAIIKARFASVKSGLPAIADDSGIEVAALNGAPGIRSARFAGEGASDAENNEKLLSLLQDKKNRQARFRCVIVFIRHAEDPSPIIAEGSWNGRILESPEGEAGFGYDPLFFVHEKGCSSAQLEKNEKNRMSHRGQAIQVLLRLLQEQGEGTDTQDSV